MFIKHKILEILEFSWKRLITLGLVLLCLSALAFCLFKVTYHLLNKPIPPSKNSQWAPKAQSSTFTPRTTLAKGMFYLTAEDFVPLNDQVELVEGQMFHIIKTIQESTNLECRYGMFQLVKKTYNQFNFKVLEHFEGRRIEHFARFRGQTLKYRVVNANQISPNSLNCKNWLFINNDYLMNSASSFSDSSLNSSTAKTRTIEFSKSKCVHISAANLVAVQSNTPNVLYFEMDRIENKLKMCIQKTGLAHTQIMTLNSGKFQNEDFNIQINKKPKLRAVHNLTRSSRFGF